MASVWVVVVLGHQEAGLSIRMVEQGVGCVEARWGKEDKKEKGSVFV